MAAIAYALDPLRDQRHRDAAAARDLADWLSYLELANMAARTIDSYERYCAGLLRDWPATMFADFTDGELGHSLKKHPPKSRHIVKAAWNNWFGWGYKTRRIPGNPVDLLPSIKYRARRDYDIYTEVEVEALCALPSPDGLLMALPFDAGLRMSEMRCLTGKRIDFLKAQVVVKEGAKGSKQRTVPMIARVPRAMNDLFMLEGIGPDDHLWATRPGGGKPKRNEPISATAFYKWWGRCHERAGVRYRRPHLARHTFATRLREVHRVEAEDVQIMLGHESIRTTIDTYSHPSHEALAARVREKVADR